MRERGREDMNERESQREMEREWEREKGTGNFYDNFFLFLYYLSVFYLFEGK